MENKYQQILIENLKPYANNARTHDKKQIAKIAKSIKEFGFINPVLIEADHGVIAGHGRIEAAKKMKLKTVPCVLIEHLTEAQKKAYILADNRLALDAGWDEEMLKIELQSLADFDFDLSFTGFDVSEVEAHIRQTHDAEKEDDVPELPKEPQSKLGDIYLLGSHRVMCGDSTDGEQVSILMDGAKADMVFTDPPYGVNYSQKEERLGGKKGHNKISNDESVTTAKKIWEFVFKNFAENMKQGASYYVCAPQGGDQMMMMMMKNHMPCKHELIWVKPSPVFSMGRLDYDYQHEPILYGWLGSHKFQGGGEFKKSVWHIERNKENKIHPTMKPVELVENAIKNSSLLEDLVLDLFLGSGSTLIAAEKTGRVCYGMELDPLYVDVIVKRWEDYTGQKAILKRA